MPTEIPPSSFPNPAPPQMLEQITFLREPSASGRASSPPASFCPNSPPRRKRPNNWKTDGVSSVGRSVGRSLNRRPPMITLQEQGGLSVWPAPFIFSQLCFGLPALIVHGAPLKGIANADSPLSLSFPSLFVGSATAHLLTSIMNPRFDIKALSRLVFSSCSSPSSFHILPVVQKCSFQKHLPDGRTAGSGRQVKPVILEQIPTRELKLPYSTHSRTWRRTTEG